MLSRATILSGQQFRALAALGARTTSTTPSSSTAVQTQQSSSVPRPVRLEPGKVRLGFVPEEWFTAFYKKTGVTGPYALIATLATYMVSKEVYVLEHEFYNGISFLIMWVYGVKKFGPVVAKYLDEEVDKYEKSWSQGREDETKVLQEQVSDEEKAQWSLEGQRLLVQAKRENVALQLEAAYRQRVQSVYQTVKKRLDFQVEKTNIERRIVQKNLVDYVVRKVRAAITPEQEKQNIDKCIADLAALAK